MAHIHDKIDFAVGALIVHDGRVCLVHHRELDCWLIPGGHVELNEDTDEALFREIEEETGLTPNDLEILAEHPDVPQDETFPSKVLFAPRWMNIHPINAHHRHLVFEYVLKSKNDNLRLAGGEHHEIRWFSLDELRDPKYQIPREIRWYAEEAIRIAV